MRLLLICLAVCTASLASAKGLDDLSNNNPEAAEGEGDAAAPAGEGNGEGEEKGEGKPDAGNGEAAKPQRALSKTLSQNLSIATGFARVIASKSTGDWESNGMTDLTVAYKLSSLSKIMNLHGTYRYAPVAVSGTEDEHSYRGVWEAHMFGARVAYQVSQTLTALGSAELGYVASHLTAIDGLDPVVKKHEAGGAIFAVGGGADWTIGEKAGFAGGPRLFAGFGSFTIIQIGGALSFLF